MDSESDDRSLNDGRYFFPENDLAEFEDIAVQQGTEAPAAIRIGSAEFGGDGEKPASFPLMIPLRESRGLAIAGNGGSGEAACRLMQLIALRLVSGLRADLRRCRFVDMTRFGGHFPYVSGLHETVVSKHSFITDERDLDRLLPELTETAGTIIRTRLTYRYQDLTDYNRHSGALEPYHFLFIADFPAGFNREKVEKLARIIQNGATTGIYVFLSYTGLPVIDSHSGLRDEIAEKLVHCMPLLMDVDSGSCRLANIEGAEKLNDLFALKVDGVHRPVPVAAVESLIERLNRNCRAEAEQQGVQESGIRIPIGKKGPDVHYFTLGHGSNNYHALVGGLTGWGKTVLLHAVIARSMAHYSPEELELWLMDYKEGTEFNIYRGHPNVAYLSVENSVEQGIEILERLQGVIAERGEMFKAENVSELTRFNEKAERKLPRILLIVDEFQKLLENYKVSTKVNALLEDVAKRGRSFGIHLLLCTQSLKNSKLEQTTRNQLGLRIVFKLYKSECGGFFDYNNEAPAGLTQKGEAIYNTDNGQPNANEKIMVDYIDENEIAGLSCDNWWRIAGKK
ncbi:MAG: FtsK/SpoIIIE domain-containing protein [Thermodesulfobacteriota bacterium]